MIKIVSDSSSNLFTLEGVPFQSVPLKINAGDREYVDTPELDLAGMVADLRRYKGKSGTSCPNFQEWYDSFREADQVFAASITSKMSGSCSSARQAAAEFEQENPGKQVYVVDTLSAGPGMRLQIEYIRDRILEGMGFREIQESLAEYRKRVHLVFSLESLHNLAQNGRCSHAVARLAGVLGIRLVGEELEGDLHPLHKCRGEKRTLETLASEMEKAGFADGCRAYITHCFNLPAAEKLRDMLLQAHPQAQVGIEPATALCCFYAEQGGLMIGFESK